MKRYFVRCVEKALRDSDSFGNNYFAGTVLRHYMGYDEQWKPVMESWYGFRSYHRASAIACMEKKRVEREERDIMRFDSKWEPVWERHFDVVSMEVPNL